MRWTKKDQREHLETMISHETELIAEWNNVLEDLRERVGICNRMIEGAKERRDLFTSRLLTENERKGDTG